MNIEGGAKGVVFSLVMSLIKGLGAKAIGIIVKGLILGVVFALVLTPLIFSWGEFSKLRFLISVVFFFAAIAGVVVVYVLHRAPEIIDPSIDHTIASNYDYLQSKVGGISEKVDPSTLFNSSKAFILSKLGFLSPFLSGLTYEQFSKYANTAAQLGSNVSGKVNSTYSYLNKLQDSKDDPEAYLVNFLSPIKALYRIPINDLKGKVKLALILVPILCLGIRIWMNADLVKSFF
ncbi:MAG: hypothetical protein IKP81_11445 [Paludibacteraceae bacterium]|nr:hypothetical protein [Paludibacteraceae bacterium]MBR6105655.1 hypothetical protein [Paludibacteraceae bacterium]